MRNVEGVQQYRVWIVRYSGWSPATCQDVPPRMEAIEPAEEGCLTAVDAAEYVEAYNEAMLTLTEPRDRWAVPVPVKIRYDGDLTPGQEVDASLVARLAEEIGLLGMESTGETMAL